MGKSDESARIFDWFMTYREVRLYPRDNSQGCYGYTVKIVKYKNRIERTNQNLQKRKRKALTKKRALVIV